MAAALQRRGRLEEARYCAGAAGCAAGSWLPSDGRPVAAGEQSGAQVAHRVRGHPDLGDDVSRQQPGQGEGPWSPWSFGPRTKGFGPGTKGTKGRPSGIKEGACGNVG